MLSILSLFLHKIHYRSHSRQQSIYKKSESAKSAVQKVDFNNTSAAQLSRDYNVPVIGRYD